MEPIQLQLALNVVTITGMTSLAGYCYLLRKENRRLATRQASAPVDAPKAEVANTVVDVQIAAPSSKPVNTVEIDIRTLASARRARWVNGMASSVS